MNSVIDMALTEGNLRRTGDLRDMHRMVMSEFKTLPKTESPRAELRAQFRVCLPGDQFASTGTIRVLVRGGDEAATPDLGQKLTIVVRVAAEKRNGRDKDGAGAETRRPVNDDEAYEWAAGLLARNGLAIGDQSGGSPLTVSPLIAYGRGPIRFHARDLHAQVTVTDAQACGLALSNGLGRGKNYGLGMILTTALA